MKTNHQPYEIYITRVFNAHLKKVWQAWVDPDQVGQWWGPRGFSITTNSKDVRTNGSWIYTMHGPDGVNYPNHTKFLEVENYSKMVYDHGSDGQSPPLFQVTAQFKDLNNKTELSLTFKFATAEVAEQMKKFIKDAGGDATWDRLAEFLAATSIEENSQKDIFVINRSFNAPVEVVYDSWTQPEKITAWLSPTGTTMKFIKADISVGGSTFWSMEGENGVMYAKAKYLELNKPNKIVYTQQFVDQNQNTSRHPLAPTWPETMLTTIEFSKEDFNQTRITITWNAFGEVTNEELNIFKSARGGMTQGWTGSFDQLENYLQNLL